MTIYATLVQHLLANQGRLLTYDEILLAMYPDDNEPEYAMVCLRFFICMARRSGWTIQGMNRRGYIMT